MHLVFDIFQGIGIAAALGIRPLLPVLAVGGLAAASVQIHFDHTDFSFLQSPLFLLAVAVVLVAVVVAERRFGETKGRAALLSLGLLAVVLGALEFGGSLCRGGYAVWPGIVGGVLCAAVGVAASRPLLARVRARLDAEAAGLLPVLAELVALMIAVLSVVVPPIGPLALLLLVWLIVRNRRRDDQKYAGLRILR